MRQVQDTLAAHHQAMRKFDEKMVEIEDKLNGLIGYLDNGRRPSEQ
jgi:hypothetical protein